METKDCFTNFYETYDEEGRLISKHGMVEYITTMKYIETYLKPNMRVLEIVSPLWPWGWSRWRRT